MIRRLSISVTEARSIFKEEVMPSLILTRKLNEWVDIADGEIKVKVVRISGGQVKLMFQADADIPIMRGELVEKVNAT